jgi:O-acetyl-ADP-ribose deacetylase (regulator of RNase III)
MIHLLQGSLFDTDAEAWVNTVNTVGVMGKGIALQFKERFPRNFELYEAACKRGELRTGQLLMTETGLLGPPRFIINFPTKAHWREKSRLSYIEEGMAALAQLVQQFHIQSIALPPLGCGNGGLDWKLVRPVIEAHLAPLDTLNAYLFEPSGQAYQAPRKRQNAAPALTPTRAMILHSLYRYQQKGYEITLLEIQKLVYFLQRLGVDFGRLSFERGPYGPYAQALQHAIHDLDGHYLDGMKYGDARPNDPITLRREHLPAIHAYVEQHFSDQEKTALATIDRLINGFETPLGLETLSTLDFLIQEQPSLRRNPEALAQQVHGWSQRKAALIKPYYLQVSLQRLEELSGLLYSAQ